MHCADIVMLVFLPLCFIEHLSSQFACPSGWTQHAEYCYLIITEPKLTWSEGSGRCRAVGSELALPVTTEAIGFLWSMYRYQTENLNATQLSPGGIWLGCRQTAGVWDCTNTPRLDFASWQSGHYTWSGKCLVMWHYLPKWSKINCETVRMTACQQRIRGDCSRRGRCHQWNGPGHQTCLLNHVLKEVHVRNPAVCCAMCINDPRCHSFNLIGSRPTCQLNTAQLSDVNLNEETATNDTCVYYSIN